MDTTRTPTGTRLFATVAAVLLLGLGAASCGQVDTAAGAAAAGASSAARALELDAAVIDVRTPEEFDEAHVVGAELIDIRGEGFDAAIAELDPSRPYVVYCRTGNRSADAAQRMREAGLEVLDGGSLQDMAGGGWPTTA